DVAAAPIRLPVALALAIRHGKPAFEYGRIGVEKAVAHALLQAEAAGKVGRVQIIEENATDAARLTPVLEIKVFIAPLLVARVMVGAERRERVAANAVEMRSVLLEPVVRREVHAAAEPPDGRTGVPGVRGKEAHVHVHGGYVRIA